MNNLANFLYENIVFNEKLSILDFFERGFSLTDDDRFKTFELKYTPWIKTLCGWFEDSTIDWIYLIFGSQTSKTTFMMGTLLYIAQYVDGATPVLWTMSTEDEAKTFVKERLRSFLDESGRDAINNNTWKQSSFRVYNSSVKVGYASNKTTLRTKPCRFVFGDECGIWKESTDYVKKRTRTFEGKKKGIFATTPPDSDSHHSWQEATAGNFYQWSVPCPHCQGFQVLQLSGLNFGEKINGKWDLDSVRLNTKYICIHCQEAIPEISKLEMLNKGKIICINPHTFEECEEKISRQKTLQISALYSVFTTWGQLACDFLRAKEAGEEALKIFFTDELAQIKKSIDINIKSNQVAVFEEDREKGYPEGYDVYTMGIDVQRKGELYYVLMGWLKGQVISGHILDYDIISWKDVEQKTNWDALLKKIEPYKNQLYRVCLDATDGLVSEDIHSLCKWYGDPFRAIRDVGGNQVKKIEYKYLQGKQKTFPLLQINSTMFKDEISTAFNRKPDEEGAWTFPKKTDIRFYQHLSNEIRITNKGKVKWIPRYANAPQHWFSALVYATCAKEEARQYLITSNILQNDSKDVGNFKRQRSKGISVW
jgi:phage terminase large subunit GpA-like protein